MYAKKMLELRCAAGMWHEHMQNTQIYKDPQCTLAPLEFCERMRLQIGLHYEHKQFVLAVACTLMLCAVYI